MKWKLNAVCKRHGGCIWMRDGAGIYKTIVSARNLQKAPSFYKNTLSDEARLQFCQIALTIT